MNIIKKNHFILLFTIFYILSFITYSAQAIVTSDLHIVEDSDNTSTLPKYFRKTTNLEILTKLKSLDLTGMDTLNISGSAQFTAFNLPLIKNEIQHTFTIIDVDLREESHGFVNGVAISFEKQTNNVNKGLPLDEIITVENKDLTSINLNTPLTFYNNKTVIPLCVENELQLTKSNHISYIRIPVTDGELPTDDMVKYFLDFVNSTPDDTWLHFHCKAGIGRTTTFMIMYDIIKNCSSVSLNDIITRETLLSSISKKDLADFHIGRRYAFLEEFYATRKILGWAPQYFPDTFSKYKKDIILI